MDVNRVQGLPTATEVLAIWVITEVAQQRRASDDRAWSDGYRAGFVAGEEVGYGRAHEEMARAWRAAYEAVQRHARMPSYAELEQRRNQRDTHTGDRHAA